MSERISRARTSTASDTDPQLSEMLRGLMPLAAHLGFHAVSGDADTVVMKADWAAEHCTANGVLHGGYLMSMADTTGATLAVFNLSEGAITSTIESKTNFFRPVTEGEVTATATVIHKGRTTIVVQTDIVDAAGRHVTRTLQTQAVIAPSA